MPRLIRLNAISISIFRDFSKIDAACHIEKRHFCFSCIRCCDSKSNTLGGILLTNNDQYKYGLLPKNGSLAAAYVPIQSSASPAYDSGEALNRGTLFPGLDLPFMGMVNTGGENTPLRELMAIDFVVDELELYLDTHKNDSEAFEMYQAFLSLQNTAHARYTEKYGPVCQKDLIGAQKYTWINDPWPWDYCGKKEG